MARIQYLVFLNPCPMSTTEPNAVQVYAGTMMEAGFIQSLLESEGIQAYLKDEIMGTLVPWYASPGGAGAVKVLVEANDAVKANQVVAAYRNNLSAALPEE